VPSLRGPLYDGVTIRLKRAPRQWYDACSACNRRRLWLASLASSSPRISALHRTKRLPTRQVLAKQFGASLHLVHAFEDPFSTAAVAAEAYTVAPPAMRQSETADAALDYAFLLAERLGASVQLPRARRPVRNRGAHRRSVHHRSACGAKRDAARGTDAPLASCSATAGGGCRRIHVRAGTRRHRGAVRARARGRLRSTPDTAGSI
jgi:hypothetical protein